MTTRASIQGFARACLTVGLALAASLFAASASAESPVRSIDVTFDGDTYIANTRMYAPVPPALAWEVLTDFTHMSSFVPNVIESHILTPGDKKFTIEQKGNAKFGGLSIPYTSQREIVVNPQATILSTQVKGSMKRQQSLMTVVAEGDGTRLQYHLEIVPSFIASKAMSPEFLKHEIDEQFTAIVGEMIKRKK